MPLWIASLYARTWNLAKEVGVIGQLCLPSCGRYGNGKFRQKPLRE